MRDLIHSMRAPWECLRCGRIFNDLSYISCVGTCHPCFETELAAEKEQEHQKAMRDLQERQVALLESLTGAPSGEAAKADPSPNRCKLTRENNAKSAEQQQLSFDEISIDERRMIVDPNNANYPLNKFVGNKEAVRRISHIIFSALGNRNRDCSEYSFALCGPASTGKTYLVKLFADVLKIPFVSIDPQSVESVHDIFVEIEKICAKDERISLVEYPGGRYFLPPMIVFIDGVHKLRNSIVHGLLKATEPNGRVMVTEKGYEVLTHKVCWIIAANDRSDLLDAFDTRFQKVNLQRYSLEEIAQIVKMNNADFGDDLCLLVARYSGDAPREALAFARDMSVEKEMSGSESWEEVAKAVASLRGAM